mgnify:FL=1
MDPGTIGLKPEKCGACGPGVAGNCARLVAPRQIKAMSDADRRCVWGMLC